MKRNKMFQVSTLQALALGYSRPVITVEEAAFDTCSLKEASGDDIKKAEQGNNFEK